MRSLTLCALLITALSVSGCCTGGTCKVKVWMSSQCTIPPVTTSEDDILTRKTLESIAKVNERLRVICVD